ncbi:MAG TPA: hypothetical protein DCO83_04105 [Mucilaginibacter sp.]|jgi:hypothetical protein|nr:hypothetical protein [Mucilaginibacter sp.]
MQKGKNKYHQNRPGLALGLLVLFMLLTALCPVKRIFFSSVSTPLLHQKAKIIPEKQSTNLQQFKAAGGGLCCLSCVTFKQSITHKPVVNADFISLAAFTLALTLLFRAFSFRVGPVPLTTNYYTVSTPIFIRNQIFLI